MIPNVLQIGYGDVRKKILPALGRLKGEGLINQVAVCDIKKPNQLDPVVDRFYLIEHGCRLPLERLEAKGFLGEHVLALVCPISSVHHVYTAILSPLVWRVASEKPVDVDLVAARVIAAQPNGFLIDHVLFKEAALGFLDRCRDEPRLLERCEAFVGVYLETGGVNYRALDPIPLDITYHLANLVGAALRVAGFSSFYFRLTKTLAATYDRKDKPEDLRTASLIQGMVEIETPRRSIPFLFVAGKGMPESQKRLFVQGPDQLIDLSESGYMPHYRAIRELLKPNPDMHTSAELSLKVLGLCLEAERRAEDCGSYQFGSWPQFITEVNLPNLLKRAEI